MMVKEAIDPLGSVPPNPGISALALGARLELALVANGGWLGVGVGAGSGVGVGAGIGVGVGAGIGVTAVVTVAVAAVPLLLAGVGSGVVELLLAVSVTVPDAGATKLMVLATVAALAKVATAGKLTIPVAALYVPPLETTTPVKPGMMLSVTITLAAALGPLLTVEIV